MLDPLWQTISTMWPVDVLKGNSTECQLMKSNPTTPTCGTEVDKNPTSSTCGQNNKHTNSTCGQNGKHKAPNRENGTLYRNCPESQNRPGKRLQSYNWSTTQTCSGYHFENIQNWKIVRRVKIDPAKDYKAITGVPHRPALEITLKIF